MAFAHRQGGQIVVPVIDGRKGRFYCAVYRGREELVAKGDLSVAACIARLAAYPTESFLVTGTHAGSFVEQVREIEGQTSASRYIVDDEYIGAANSLRAIAVQAAERGDFDPIDLGPVYLRKSDAEIGGATSRGE
jgi:tRNA A37 threonylcarbamoyladenosine modification protein TsaB